MGASRLLKTLFGPGETQSDSRKNREEGKQEAQPPWTKRMFSMCRKQAEKAARENSDAHHKEGGEDKEKLEAPPKKIPVFFIDEAHKL